MQTAHALGPDASHRHVCGGIAIRHAGADDSEQAIIGRNTEEWTAYVNATVNFGETPGMARLFRRLEQMPHIDRGEMRLLEHGAGGLRDAKAAAMRGFNSTAIDPCRAILQAEASLDPELKEKITCINGTLSGARLEVQSHFMCNSQNVLGFMPDEKVVSELKEMLRVLKPGGLLNISFFSEGHIFENDPKWEGKTYFRSEYVAEQLVRQAGFAEVRAETIEHITPTSIDPKMQWKLVHVDAMKPLKDDASRAGSQGRRMEAILRDSMPA